MTRRYVCLHGHFYQPPRENPWLEEVEVQDSAAPFHDWNERIAAECYRPNSAARIKGADGRIADIVNSYNHLSFNFGPTLLSWLERALPSVYRRILEADATSLARRGHGNALAQAYSHPILPLCSSRDRRTQIRWGLADFRRRFGRVPEGFWLPETAADTETLRDLAREGVRYTILSPYQAQRVRPPGGEWQDVSGARFDPTRPYRVPLGEGLSIVVFFYDAPIAREFAFGNGAARADDIVRALEGGFDSSRGHDEVLVVAVDGETFGHHRKGFDEALAQALRRLADREDLELINLGQALERVPADWEAMIIEGASWSCAHGLERWKSDCGCTASGQPGWHQRWRAPLREALDGLRGHLVDLYEREAGTLFADPWAARDDYIGLVLDRERRDSGAFLARHALRLLDRTETTRAFKLLELQRHALLMYTSCGWFFAELSGLETVQVLKYAARAIQLARELSGVDLEPLLVDGLSRAPSNLPQFQDGAGVWRACVRPGIVPLETMAAHYAIASIAEPSGPSVQLACYPVEVRARRQESAGGATLVVGRLCLDAALVAERLDVSYCVLHLGGSDVRCGLRPFVDAGQQAVLERDLFGRLGSLSQLLREIDRVFWGRDFGLRDLFLDERRRVASLQLRESMRRYESDYVQIFESNRRLMELLRELDLPIPRPLRVAADVALTARLQQQATALVEGAADLATLHSGLLGVAQLAHRLEANLDLESVRPLFDRLIHDRLEMLGLEGVHRDPAFELIEVIDLSERLGLQLDLSAAQDRLWGLVSSRHAPQMDRDTLERLAARLWFDAGTLEKRARMQHSPARGQASPAVESQGTAQASG
ncbi:MAG: DUF3536 domain-containing protein [Deltaproteobacteria bacterium]|nr:DUF3536 domain-containing protein [Deltaproteobacteria bacterium]